METALTFIPIAVTSTAHLLANALLLLWCFAHIGHQAQRHQHPGLDVKEKVEGSEFKSIPAKTRKVKKVSVVSKWTCW